MVPPPVPKPAARRTRKAPWVAMGLGSVVGLALFVWLWSVAVELQRENAPKHPVRTWQESVPP